ncbi:magnesium chelatase accessory protein [Roseiarcus fermentans]|uniref:Magnesium chelatase accessory protein n=1 Tax=Roseiarcus fermentans TaxID=1473586 RepID=A0A366F9H5_9HYPH|nr:alpha/beta fold hydrolase BchO [Roseiarcus fermentans]RBP11313.1 magnesium chelatase accessory protein [Roseiarcus fermentans]
MLFGPEPLDFDRDGRDWPNRQASAFVETRGYRWHVQRMGEGPQLLLIHGTGAATHSFAGLMPLLAQRFDVVAPDLPGHGFTRSTRSPDLSLPGIARALAALVKTLEFRPQVVVGHSAGAAILVRLCLDGAIDPALLVSLNGAFLPFGGAAAFLFPTIAKLLFLNPFAPRVFSWAADRKGVEDLLRGTGSAIDRHGIDLYARLFGNAAHVAGAIGMMANWDLSRMSRDLARLGTRTLFVVAENDKAVSPADAPPLARAMPDAEVATIRHAGHLAHEEKPEEVCELILAEAVRCGVIAAPKPATQRRRKPRRETP